MDKNKRLIQLAVIGGGVLLLIIIFSSRIFVSISPGERGVLYQPLAGGLDPSDTPYQQGLHIIAPWNRMIVYDVRKHENEQKLDVLSSNGLDIGLDLSTRYRVVPDSIGYLHNEIGKDYKNRIIVPEVRSATRQVIGQYTPEELYASERNEIQGKIHRMLDKSVDNNYLDLDALLIRSIQLPPKIKEAIEMKLAEEQTIQQKEYAKQKEKKEAERREIEARGKAKANEILNASLTDKVLRDKGIEATRELAGSENAKTVVIGGGGDGLPLILGNK